MANDWEPQNGRLDPPPSIPPEVFRLGATVGTWFSPEPGIAVIQTDGGTIDDRCLVETILRESLGAVGIRQAKYSVELPQNHNVAAMSHWEDLDFVKNSDLGQKIKLSSWDDIMQKAQRLVQSGNVTLLRNGYNNVVAHVIGDHGQYQSEISRDDPDSRAITQWTCECPWDQYAFQRTRKWKKYEARPCAHVLAAYWQSLSTPLDEQMTGPQAEGMGTGQALPPTMPGSGFGGGSPMAPPSPGGMVQPTSPAGPGPMMPPQGPMIAPPPGAPTPGQQGVLPPFPMAPEQMQAPVSIPNPLGPYPANPVQQPGTFSHTVKVGGANDEFPPQSTARMEEATYGQSEGREGATDAGQWMEIPKGAQVEVVNQDPTTGWCEVMWPLRGGPMTSYHVRCFVEPEKLTPLPGRKSPFEVQWG